MTVSPPARHVLLRRLAALELLRPGARVMSTLAPTQNFPLIDAAVRPARPGGGRAPCVAFTVRIGFVLRFSMGARAAPLKGPV